MTSSRQGRISATCTTSAVKKYLENMLMYFLFHTNTLSTTRVGCLYSIDASRKGKKRDRGNGNWNIKMLPFDEAWSMWRNWRTCEVDSLAPGRFGWNFISVIFKLTLAIDGWGIFREIALRWVSPGLTDDTSLVQVMAWCRQATSHYMS